MFYQKIDNSNFLIRIEKGEEILTCLKKFCLKLKIKSGFFYGLGALDQVTLANYNVSEKKYLEKKFKKSYELTNITGNISFFENDIVIHAHGTLADEKMMVVGGHFMEGVVSGTAELYLTALPIKIFKKYDKETGLKLMDLSEKV